MINTMTSDNRGQVLSYVKLLYYDIEMTAFVNFSTLLINTIHISFELRVPITNFIVVGWLIDWLVRWMVDGLGG